MRFLRPSRIVGVFLSFLLGISGVEAVFHLMVVEQVFPGTPGAPDAQYVMLRMTAYNQNFITGKYLRVEDSDGNLLGRFGTFTPNDLTGGSICTYPSCPAILIGTQAAEDLFFPESGTTFDQIVDGQTAGGDPLVLLPTSGGRVCFVDFDGTTVIDCVAWGDFDCRESGNCSLRNNQRTGDTSGNFCDLNFNLPASALSLGKGLDRQQFNCSEKKNSVDFIKAFPTPVSNSGANANTDSDSDGLIDVLDCADSDATSLYFPVETEGVNVAILAEGATVISWVPQDEMTGTSTVYDIVTGFLSDLLFFEDYLDATCLAQDVTGSSITDPSPELLPEEGRYDLVRTKNNCLTATFGDSSLVPDPRDLLDDTAPPPPVGPCN